MQLNTIAINQLANIANTKNCNSEINQALYHRNAHKSRATIKSVFGIKRDRNYLHSYPDAERVCGMTQQHSLPSHNF